MARDYGRVHTAFWNSQAIRTRSDRGKLLANYLLTGPHSNSIGAYLLPDAYIGDDLGWDGAAVKAAIAELTEAGFCARFADGRHIVICKFLEWNPIENPNVGKAALRQLEQLPIDPAVEHVLAGLQACSKQFPNGLETVLEQFRTTKPCTKPETNHETKPEMEYLAAVAAPPQAAVTVRLEIPPIPDCLKRPRAKPQPKGEPEGFPAFYDAYPLHRARPEAAKAYAAAVKRATPEALLAGAHRYAAERKGEEQKFTAHPATWLNQNRWQDEESKHVASSGKSSSKQSAIDTQLAGIAAGLAEMGGQDYRSPVSADSDEARDIGGSFRGSGARPNAGAPRGASPAIAARMGQPLRDAGAELPSAGHDGNAGQAEIPNLLLGPGRHPSSLRGESVRALPLGAEQGRQAEILPPELADHGDVRGVSEGSEIHLARAG